MCVSFLGQDFWHLLRAFELFSWSSPPRDENVPIDLASFHPSDVGTQRNWYLSVFKSWQVGLLLLSLCFLQEAEQECKSHLAWLQSCEKGSAGSWRRCCVVPIPLRPLWSHSPHWYCGLNRKQKPRCTVQEGTSWLHWRTVCRCDSVGIHPGQSRVSNWFSLWGHWSPIHQNSEPHTWISWTTWYYSPDKTRCQNASELNTDLNAGMAQMFLGINHIL